MSGAERSEGIQIGEKLRLLRAERQMTLRELAEMAAVSASMLSQIENNKAYPSVRSLYAIAAALNVPVDYFFPNAEVSAVAEDSTELTASEMRAAQQGAVLATLAVEGPTQPIRDVRVSRQGRPTIQLQGGVTWTRLTAKPEPYFEVLEIIYAPGATSGAALSHHRGREFGLIQEGELLLELGFERTTLQAGDSVVFNSSTPHRLTNTGAIPMRAIWFIIECQAEGNTEPLEQHNP